MPLRCRFIRSVFATLAVAALAPIETSAHVDWNRVNGTQPGLTVGLYHFDEHEADPGMALIPALGLPADRGLLIGIPAGDGMIMAHDTPKEIFESHCLHLRSAQIADSTATVGGLDGDLTIEFWFKWDLDLISQRVQIGLRSGAKLVIARNTVTPASDALGIAFVHGDFVSAPGFTNWVDVGPEEGGLGEWRHVALTLVSTGQHFDTGLGHDIYNPGSTARIWLNGHATGSTPHTVDIAGMRTHPDSRIRIQSLEGPIKVDEVTVWTLDWSQDGTVANPFHEGRGDLPSSSVENWNLY